MLNGLSLVLGGAASGKSEFAEMLIKNSGRDRLYIATAQVWDDEMQAKIDRHLRMRGPDWQTIEAPMDLSGALAQARPEQVVLLDCITMWLSNQMLAETDLKAAEQALFDALQTCQAPIVAVSNELGLSVVPDNALARQFRELQGRLNQKLAAQSELVVTVTAGLPMVLKGQLP